MWSRSSTSILLLPSTSRACRYEHQLQNSRACSTTISLSSDLGLCPVEMWQLDLTHVETVSRGQVTDCHQIVKIVSSFLPCLLTRPLQFVEELDCRDEMLISAARAGRNVETQSVHVSFSSYSLYPQGGPGAQLRIPATFFTIRSATTRFNSEKICSSVCSPFRILSLPESAIMLLPAGIQW